MYGLQKRGAPKQERQPKLSPAPSLKEGKNFALNPPGAGVEGDRVEGGFFKGKLDIQNLLVRDNQKLGKEIHPLRTKLELNAYFID
jgi:hypothetical protein